MPALSRTQQRLMGQAYGVRKFMDTKGKEGRDPDTIDPEYRETIVDLADNMKKKSLKDYASTKHKKLPEEVEEGKIPTIFSKLNPESNNPVSKEKRVMQNLSDYRDFIKKYKK
jgi:hypothetical protein